MHATKLDLRIWIAAIFLVLTSSKGTSSVVMARILGVNQKTAWKLGHAIRELMDHREAVSTRLDGVGEVDEAYVGGAPKFKTGVKNKRGQGTGKPMVLVAADRNGQAKATLIPNAQGATLGPIMKEWIDPSLALMTDSNTAYRKTGRSFASHHTVNHGKRRNYVALQPSPAGGEDQEPENIIWHQDDCHDGLETDASCRTDAGVALLCGWSAGSQNTPVGAVLALTWCNARCVISD